MNSGMQKYIIKQKIGVGSFGQVFQVHDTKRNQTFAMKKMKQHFSSEQYVKELMEVKIMSKLRHPNIIELRQYSYDKQSQQGNLFFEYCQSDICKKFCYNHKQRPPESQIKKHIFEIASALCFAHSKNFIHRDIKPQNILIQKNQFQGKQFDVAKLCDFGISKKADELPLTDYVGTRWYRAPQLLIKMKNYSKNVDIFSLGCIMAEFYNMQILFNGKNSIDQLVLIMKKLGTPTKQSWPQFSNWCKLKGITYGKYQRSEDPIIFKAKRDDLAEDLIQKMLVMNPKNRISSAEYVFAKNSVLKHPYFNDIRSQLLARQYAARPVRQVSVQQSQNHEITSTKSLKQIQNSSKSVQNAQVDTHHSTHKKQEGNLSTKKSDEKNLKMKESKQTQSSQAIKEVKDIKELQTDISRPPVIKKTINQRQKAKSPVFYSPYSPNGGKGNSHKSKEKKFDYYLTYVVGRMNQNRTQSNYQQSNSNYISSNYSHHQPQSK